MSSCVLLHMTAILPLNTTLLLCFLEKFCSSCPIIVIDHSLTFKLLRPNNWLMALSLVRKPIVTEIQFVTYFTVLFMTLEMSFEKLPCSCWNILWSQMFVMGIGKDQKKKKKKGDPWKSVICGVCRPWTMDFHGLSHFNRLGCDLIGSGKEGKAF